MNCAASSLITAAYAAGYGQLSLRSLKEVLVASACKRAGSSCDLTVIINALYASGYPKGSSRDISESQTSAACAGVGGGGACSMASLESKNATNGYAKLSAGDLVRALIAASCS